MKQDFSHHSKALSVITKHLLHAPRLGPDDERYHLSSAATSPRRFDTSTINLSLLQHRQNMEDATRLTFGACEAKCANSSLQQRKLLAAVKAVCFFSGSVLSFISQILLYVLIWDDNVLSKSVPSILIFSLQWSFWTLLIVFIGISAQKYLLSRSCSPDEIIFQVEVYYVAGALSGIAATCLMTNMVTFSNQLTYANTSILVAVAFSIYASCCTFVLIQSRPEAQYFDTPDVFDASICTAYQMIAGLSGLLIGATTQLLPVLLWWPRYDAGAERLLSTFLLLSFWTLATFAVTNLGLWCTQRIVVCEHCFDASQYKQLMVLVDAAYIRFTVIGIFTAWIGSNMFAGLTGGILVSISTLILAVLFCSSRKLFFSDDNEEHTSKQILLVV